MKPRLVSIQHDVVTEALSSSGVRQALIGDYYHQHCGVLAVSLTTMNIEEKLRTFGHPTMMLALA
jgi:hypothetical protein